MTGKDFEETFADVIGQLEQEFAWGTGAELRGFNLYKTEGGWLLVLKTLSQQRGRLVAFYGGATAVQCCEQLMYDLHHAPGVTWKQDKYAK
jgi:hypothetical protein